MKQKNVSLTDGLFDELAKESKATGISANSIIVIALTEYLAKKEKERK